MSNVIGTPANPDGAPVAPGTESQTTGQTGDIISSDNAKNLVEIATFGKGSGHHPTYSPDGGLLAVSSSSGIYLYHSQTLQGSMHFSEADVFDIAFSPDGKTLSALSGYHQNFAVHQWDVASGSQLHSLSVPSIPSPK